MTQLRSIERKTFAALSIALLTLLVVSAMAVRAIQARENAAQRLSQVHQSLLFVSMLHGDATEAIASQDSYAVLHDPKLQQTRDEAVRRLRQHADEAKVWYANNANQSRNIDKVLALVAVELRQLDAALGTTVKVDEQTNAYFVSPERLRAHDTLEALNVQLGEMVNVDKQVIAEVSSLEKQSALLLYWIVGTVLGCALLMSLWLAWRVHQDISVRRRQEQQLQAANLELARRAQELKMSNQELESFCYSVSHDLRTPLLTIDGFAQILEYDYQSVLDGKAKHYLQKIRTAGNRMGQLIDDLLAYSRLGRQTLQVKTLDMAALANKAVEMAVQARTVQPVVEIKALPLAQGDESMLQSVWLNLIDNAIKYSSKVTQPRVEVRCVAQAEQTVYSVQDNGAGFDMRHYDKLFGVFQRLHSQEEFPGTGVGLAIVERIVQRHGGRVWAESQPGQGAIFYFSLPHQFQTSFAMAA